jgi:uncharacterized alkaline shock family protein YloU
MSSRQRRDTKNFDLQPAADTLDGRRTDAPSGQARANEGSAPAGRLTQTSSIGKIEVSPKAISHIASRVAQESYGVVGLASRHARPGLAELLRREERYKGVEVVFSGGQVVIDLYVIIEYGTRISEVARNLMSSVKFAVESALGVPVVQVNVNVQGIRVSS